MAKAVQVIVQHLSRAKAAFMKGGTIRPMVSVAEALKLMLTAELHSTEAQKVTSLLRENLQNISKIEAVKAVHPEPFVYEKGKERQVLIELVPLIKVLHSDRKKENLDAIRQRKLNIDHAIIHGKNALAGGKVEEARKYFRQATNLHVDEDAMYLIISSILQDSGAFKESFEYLRLALMANPGDRKACEMVVEASKKTAKPDRGLVMLKKIGDKKGPSAHLLYAMAQIAAQKRQVMEAVRLAQKALEMDEQLVDARKFLRKMEKKAAKGK